jgi:hypothetical protein
MHRVLGASAALLALFTLLAVPADARPRAARDTARIVPWRSIGAARIGSRITAVNHVYGRPARVRNLSDAVPPTTRWHGHRVIERTYRVRGGELWVRTVDGRVRAVGTTSTRYRTPGGIRVGLRVHSRCRESAAGGCSPYWKGFVFQECAGWLYGRRGLVVSLGTARDRVARLAFGDPDVMLLCV